MLFETVFTLFILLLIVYYVLHSKNLYWKKRGVPGPKPSLFSGNIGETLKMKKSLGEVIAEIYQNHSNLPFVGIFISRKPALLIRDPEFVKNITVKDFGHFVDNNGSVDKKLDPLLGRHPFYLKGDEWRGVRGQLTPCFTSAKMKIIFHLIDENCQKFIDFIAKEEDAFNSNGVEAKSLCLKYTLQNVSNCAFGVDGNCFDNPNNEFIDLARRILSPDTSQALKSTILKIFPSLLPFFSLKVVSKSVEDRLQTIVTETLNYREQHNVVRNDFLHVLANLKKTYPDFTNVDITAHATGFFGDGYETSSVLLSFVLHELACNINVQKKLREELSETFDNHLTYDILQKLSYLDAVVTETLRKDPPIFYLAKTCTEPYFYQSTNEKFEIFSVSLEKGDSVYLPVYGFHHDPTYYPEPEEFIPERFLNYNKDNLYKYTYLPFGAGPRICLGMRFGLMQVKAAVAHIVRNFILTPNDKTQVPLKLNPSYPMMSPVGGLWLNFERVKKKSQ